MHLLRFEPYTGFTLPFLPILFLIAVGLIAYSLVNKSKPQKPKRPYKKRTPVNSKIDIHIHK